MCAFILGDALDRPIGQPKLALLQRQMDVVRQADMKQVLRFAYNYIDNAEDAGPELLLAHLDQQHPCLERNSGVIAAVQAGFIGSWGEWANSRHYGSGTLSEENWRDRKRVFDKVLEVAPASRMVQPRTPELKHRLAGAGPLSRADAFQRTARARTGHHNDCFLASDNDWGTTRAGRRPGATTWKPTPPMWSWAARPATSIRRAATAPRRCASWRVSTGPTSTASTTRRCWTPGSARAAMQRWDDGWDTGSACATASSIMQPRPAARCMCC